MSESIPSTRNKTIENHEEFIHLLDQRYCIEVIPDSNKGNEISILKNNQVVDKTPRLNDFNDAHRTCFDSFLPSHDIIELRNGGKNGVKISLNLINHGITTQLFFGKNADSIMNQFKGNSNTIFATIPEFNYILTWKK